MKSMILLSALAFSSLVHAEEQSAVEKKYEHGKSMLQGAKSKMSEAKAKVTEAKAEKKAEKSEKKETRKAILAGPACAKVVQECNSSGFVPGGKKDAGDNGLVADCLSKVAQGHSVTGVTATKEDALGCLKALKDGT